MGLPLRICSSCEKNLNSFIKFKKDCVENSLRLEARIKEAQYNIDIQKKCSTSETNINNLHEVYIKEEARDEVLSESDTPTAKDFVEEEICIKEDPLSLQENFNAREFGDVLNQESTPQTDTHIHEDSRVDLDDKCDLNSHDSENVISVNNEINSKQNFLVTDSAGRKVYTCLICKKNFNRLSDLKLRHMKIHLGKKDFQCTECKKWFSRNSHLTTHMKQHTGVKDFQCKECNKWFAQKGNLVKHMKLHNGLKEFQCTECKKSFSLKGNLVAHMKQHVGVKDFQCNECKKWFLHKSNLTKHMKQHRIKDLKCPFCSEMFSDTSDLNKHMIIHA